MTIIITCKIFASCFGVKLRHEQDCISPPGSLKAVVQLEVVVPPALRVSPVPVVNVSLGVPFVWVQIILLRPEQRNLNALSLLSPLPLR